MPGDSIYDPYHQHYGNWPITSGKAQIQAWSSGQSVGYAQGILHYTFGQSNTVAQLPGPWNFDVATVNAVINLQNWAGLPATGVVNAATWGVIDWAAAGFPT